MKAIIIAGGKGTRLSSSFESVPKALVPIAGRPVLEYQLATLRESGCDDVLIVVGHLADQIMDRFPEGETCGMRIHYFRESSPLGTAGALSLLLRDLDDDTIVMYGDLVLFMDLRKLLAFHRSHHGDVTVVAHPNNHPRDSDLLLLRKDRVSAVLSKNKRREGWHPNRVNAGVYVVHRRALQNLIAGAPADLERNVLLPAVVSGNAFAYQTSEFIRDMGTPARLNALSSLAATHLIENLQARRPRRAVFLDRDGTINVFAGLIHRPSDLILVDGAAESIAALNNSGMLSIVITNQPVVARGLCTVDELELIHAKLETLLGEKGAYLDEILYCPHHPESGHKGEDPRYKIPCACRKPGIALIQDAVKRHHIDTTKSYFVGDSGRDIEAGNAAGLTTFLLTNGEDGRDTHSPSAKPDRRAPDLKTAIAQILEMERSTHDVP